MNGESRILTGLITHARSRVFDFLELTKPELTSLSVLTALCGFYLAGSPIDIVRLIHVAVGTAFVGGGAGALNQYIERRYDALMRRTERRPLPSGRLTSFEGLMFGLSSSIIGLVELAYFTNALTCILAMTTLVSYLFIYTPLKRTTPFSTLVGGIPGALPPMMGWAAARNELSAEAWILFAILFCWQMPHFFSLAWLYRKDYARAGFKMLSVVDVNGSRTARQIMMFCALLIPASGALTFVGLSGSLYFTGAALLGLSYFGLSILFARTLRTVTPANQSFATLSSRRIFLASLAYLPILMLLMVLDKV